MLAAFIVIIALLLITNPSYTDFEHFSKKQEFHYSYSSEEYIHYSIRKKIGNYFIYSVYEITSYEYKGDGELYQMDEQTVISKNIYIGILGNFFELDN